MLAVAGPAAAVLAALMAERDPLKGAPPDLALRIAAVTDPRRFESSHPWPVSRPVVERVKEEARGAARTPWGAARRIVATDLAGGAREAQVRQAVAISEAELRAVHGAQIGWRQVCHWSKREGRVMARRQECFGALVLGDQHWDAPAEDVARAAL